MPSAQVVPIILIGTLIGLLAGLLVWDFWRARRPDLNKTLLVSADEMLLGLLVLAAFAMGAFLAYALLNFNFF